MIGTVSGQAFWLDAGGQVAWVRDVAADPRGFAAIRGDVALFRTPKGTVGSARLADGEVTVLKTRLEGIRVDAAGAVGWAGGAVENLATGTRPTRAKKAARAASIAEGLPSDLSLADRLTLVVRLLAARGDLVVDAPKRKASRRLGPGPERWQALREALPRLSFSWRFLESPSTRPDGMLSLDLTDVSEGRTIDAESGELHAELRGERVVFLDHNADTTRDRGDLEEYLTEGARRAFVRGWQSVGDARALDAQQRLDQLGQRSIEGGDDDALVARLQVAGLSPGQARAMVEWIGPSVRYLFAAEP